MAKNQSKSKNRLTEVLILAFVIVSVGLLVIQLGLNVMDTLEQSKSSDGERPLQEDTVSTPTPSEPTPTLDFSAPISDSN